MNKILLSSINMGERMEYLRNRVYSFIDDRLQLLSLVGVFTFCIISILFCYYEPSLEWKIRVAIYGCGVLFIFFFGHRGTWITWCIVAYVMFYFSSFNNALYFVIITMLIAFYPMLKIPMIAGYCINVFIICHLHHLEIMKIVFHVDACVFAFLSFTEAVKRVRNLIGKKLELTADEKIILDYLSRDFKQNDIPDFSPVTVSRKLRKAKLRNGIEKTENLTKRYKQEKEAK